MTLSGKSLPAIPTDARADEVIGSKSAVVAGYDFNGSPITIGEPGSRQLIVFFAHWCPHCQVELPLLVKWMAETDHAGLQIVAVATATTPARPNYPPSAWLEKEKWNGQILVDDATSSAFVAMGGGSFPYMLLLNAKGTVA